MAIARRVRLSSRASRDLDEIWTFSNERWGADRADRYVAEIRTKFGEIAAHPETGRGAGGIAASWKIRSVARHRIVYRYSDSECYVARILHMSMDERRHIP